MWMCWHPITGTSRFSTLEVSLNRAGWIAGCVWPSTLHTWFEMGHNGKNDWWDFGISLFEVCTQSVFSFQLACLSEVFYVISRCTWYCCYVTNIINNYHIKWWNNILALKWASSSEANWWSTWINASATQLTILILTCWWSWWLNN